MATNSTYIAVEYDNGSGEHEEGYYIVFGDDEVGPLTEDELSEMEDCVRTA